MQALDFYRAVTMDESNLYTGLLDLLEREGIAYCLVGGQGVNAYVIPLISLNLGFVIASADLERALEVLHREYTITELPNAINIASAGSAVRAQIQADPRYADFVTRAQRRDVLGRPTMVASIEDLLRGKVWAASDAQRRPSKRQKDLADISRILETYPHLQNTVPPEILSQLFS
ncbi:MAG TPA: hypothetical protein VN181_01400 [Thermoanaerobaculia bacterium]|nr:hypothetical protein [Thermoanaerobaculia bacterium]